uniref:Uncharacterized protein n=2 Tax=Caenorhabditis japonica TaxID=281687 RepID=A0A8R1IR47_CAEJA
MFLGNDQRSGFNWAIAENLKNVRAEQRDVTDEGVLREKGAEMEPASQLSQHVVASHSVPLPIHPSLLKAVPPGVFVCRFVHFSKLLCIFAA